VLRELSNEELWHYYAPFVIEADRQTMLNWPRLLPIAGKPSHMVAVVQLYADWLRQSQVPKLFVNAEPGSILVGAQREFCRSWPNQTEVTVKGLHFIQEDSPDEIGRAVAGWLSALE
jgi:haloalkane dehalogenase